MNNVAKFQKLCGSYQYQLLTPEDLRVVMANDDAFWALLSIPVTALNGDPLFFKYLDSTGSASIRVDDIKNAFFWLDKVLIHISVLADEKAAVSPEEIRSDTQEGKDIAETMRKQLVDALIDDGLITLAETREAIKKLSAGSLKGDGIITLDAVGGSIAEQLFTDILSAYDGPDNDKGIKGITGTMLDKFITDANAYLEWAKDDTYTILMPGVDMPPAYAFYRNVTAKVDEFFSFCKLLHIDTTNAKRFVENPEALSPIDIHDPDSVNQAITRAPLASPNPEGRLFINEDLNPAYSHDLTKLAEIFELDSITQDDWSNIKGKFAGYENYLKGKNGNSAEKLGTERLKADIANTEAIEFLRDLITQDSSIMADIAKVNTIEKLILFKQYYFRFVRGYISLFELFNPVRLSLLQAGSLIMDGKHYDLCIRVNDVAAHKKLAANSNIFIMYMNAQRTHHGIAVNQKIAVAVTAGSNIVFYPGKAGLFVDWEGNLWDTVIEDILQGPICFWQSFTLPFVKISGLISDKLGKLASAEAIANDFSNSLQKVGQTVPQKSGSMMSGSMFLLAGGVGFAAIFSGITYIFKQLNKMPALNLLYYIMLILACIMAPLVIYSLYKLYKRNFSMFFEAAGWAVNLRMKLDSIAGRFFSYYPAYPGNVQFIRLDTTSARVKKNSRINKNARLRFLLIVLFILLLAAGLLRLYANNPISASDTNKASNQTEEVRK